MRWDLPKIEHAPGLWRRPHRRVPYEAREGIVIHRCGYWPIEEAWARYRDDWGLPQFPYTFFLGHDRTWQTCDLEEVTPHARWANVRRIGIAVHGDFRKRAPTDDLWDRTAILVAALCAWWSWNPCRQIGRYRLPRVVGHGDIPGGSRTPGKRCPGEKWDMVRFRDDVCGMMDKWRTSLDAERDLRQAGALI